MLWCCCALQATMGDWSFSMILDGLNVVMEVRINDMESADVPKYGADGF